MKLAVCTSFPLYQNIVYNGISYMIGIMSCIATASFLQTPHYSFVAIASATFLVYAM